MPRAIAAFVALALAGCASPGGGGPTYPLLPPASYGARLQAQQLVTLAHGSGETTLQCHLAIEPGELRLRGYSALGQRLFSLQYDGHELRIERGEAGDLGDARIPAEQIVGDLQFALWPLPALQDAAASTAWSISEPRPGVRRLRHDGRLIAEARGADAQGRRWLGNLAQDYTLEILEDAGAAP